MATLINYAFLLIPTPKTPDNRYINRDGAHRAGNDPPSEYKIGVSRRPADGVLSTRRLRRIYSSEATKPSHARLAYRKVEHVIGSRIGASAPGSRVRVYVRSPRSPGQWSTHGGGNDYVGCN